MEYTASESVFTSGDSPDEAIGEDIIANSQQFSPNKDEVFKTKEEFQKQFDYEWNKRYREHNKELDTTKSTLEEVTKTLADFFGVVPEEAIAELKNRVSVEEQTKQAPNGESDQAFLAEVKAQFEALKDEVGEFDTENALQNQEFLQAVTHFYQTSPDQAVERAMRAVYFDLYQEAMANKAEEIAAKKLTAMRNRVPEGAISPAYSGAVKPIDLHRLGSKGILELQNRILKGEKIQF